MKVLMPRVDPGEVKYSLRPRNFAYLIRVSMRPLLFLWEEGTSIICSKPVSGSLGVPKNQVMGIPLNASLGQAHKQLI